MFWKLKLSENVNKKKVPLKLCCKKKDKDSDHFWHRKFRFSHFLTTRHNLTKYNNFLLLPICRYVNFLHKIYLILYPSLWNSTTHIIIATNVEKHFQQMEVCKPMWKLFISKLVLSNVKFANKELQMCFICENIWEKFIQITIYKFKINNVWFMSSNSKP